MALTAKAGFKGLVTACGEVTADPGALRIADNVTLRKEGAIALRATFGSTALSRAYAAAFPYNGQFVYLTSANAAYCSWQVGQLQYSYTSALGATGTVTTSNTPGLRADIQAGKAARGNFYVASSEGVYKLTGITNTGFYRSGLTPSDSSLVVGTTTTGVNDLLATNTQVAYRYVVVVVDPNGVIVISRPSGAVLVSNTSGSAVTPQLSVSLKIPNAAGIPPGGYMNVAAVRRYVELYRTRVFPTSAQVDDEMQFVATLEAPLTPGTSGSFTDKIADAARGKTLYTSPSRVGIEGANDRPPGCACIERFRTSLFFGNIVGPQRITFSFNRNNAAVTGAATGIGVRITTGNTTSGSTSITSLASTTGVRVGQTAYASTSGDMGTVASIAGTTVTTTAAASATTTGATITFQDAFTIDNLTGAHQAPGLATGVVGVPYNAYGTSGNLGASFLSGTYAAYEVTPALPGYTDTVVIERIARGGSPFELRSSRGDELSPTIALQTAGTGTLSTNDVYPHGLMWSEPDEPEHCPPKNFARVGDAGKAILALVATKDRLLIWKEDGLFMLTGDTSKNFALYPLDTTCMCVLPGSVQRLQNTVYGLTNLGLVAIDEGGGVNIVSRSVQTEIAPIVTAIRQAQASSGLYLMPGLSGVTGTADDANGEYWLMLGSSTPSFGGQMLVYNAFQQGYTTYSFGTPTPVAVTRDGQGQPLVLTASSLLTPGTTLGAITARVSPHAFSDPALVQKFWTHVVAGFSKLTGTASVTAKFSGSVSMTAGTEIAEVMDVSGAMDGSNLIQLPLGSLLKHPVPSAMRRAYLAFVELAIAVTNGTFVLDVMGMESRENIPQKDPTHGSGAT